MLLENKVAVIYGGGGAIGGAVARAFAREGARVFLAGRTRAKLDSVAADITDSGGVADSAVVDAQDERAVNGFVDNVAAQTGRIDISFNVVGYGDVQKSLLDLTVEDFLQPITTAMRSHFVTATAAARHMGRNDGGVILNFGGGGPQTIPGLGGFKVALDAIESLRRQLAMELGGAGIRVITMKTGGVPDSIPNEVPHKEQITDSIVEATALKRAASLDDVGNIAAFLASDSARTITGTEVNISCGSILD